MTLTAVGGTLSVVGGTVPDLGGGGTGTQLRVDDRTVGTGDGQWEYGAGWEVSVRDHFTKLVGVPATFRFSGDYVEYRAVLDPAHGQVGVSLDGAAPQTFDLFSLTRVVDALVFSASVTDGPHTLVVTPLGTKNTSSSDVTASVDAAVYRSTAAATVPAAPVLTVSSSALASWTVASGAPLLDGALERKRGTGAWTRITPVPHTALSYHDPVGVTGDQYRVAVSNSAGTSAYSNVVTLTKAAALWTPNLASGKSALLLEKDDSSGGSFTFPVVDGQAVMETFYNDAATAPGVKARTRLHPASGAPVNVGLTPLDSATLHFEMFVPKATRDQIFEAANGKCIGLGGLPDSQDGFYTSTGGSRKADSWSVRIDTATGSSYSGGSAYLIAYFYATYGNGITQSTNPMYGTTKYGIWAPFVTSGSSQATTPMSGRNVRVPVDQWFSLDVFVKMNTAGQKNGSLRCWMNGTKYVDLNDVQWTDSTTPKVDQFIWDMFVNNNSGSASGTSRTRGFVLYEGEVAPDGTGSGAGGESAGSATVTYRYNGPGGKVAVGHPSAGAGVQSVRLLTATDEAMTQGLAYTDPVAPNSAGTTMHTISRPPAEYFYKVEVTDTTGVARLDSKPSPGRYLIPATGRSSVSAHFVSCKDGVTTSSVAAMAADRRDYFIFMGDPYYADGTGESEANITAKLLGFLADVDPITSIMITLQTSSDHDGATDDSEAGRNPTAWTNLNAAWRKLLALPFPATDPVTGKNGHYYSVVDGPVEILMTDGRSFKTIASATDNSSKTYLGATQKQWVKDRLAALPADRLAVFVTDTPWVAAASAGSDAWEGYTTERTEVAGVMTGKPVEVLCGDQHALAVHDGVSGSPGGVPVYCSAPMRKTASHKGGPWTSRWPTTTGALIEAFSTKVWSRTSSAITAVFTGKEAPSTTRLTHTKSWTIAGGGGGTPQTIAKFGTDKGYTTPNTETTTTVASVPLDKPGALLEGQYLIAHLTIKTTGTETVTRAGWSVLAATPSNVGSQLVLLGHVVTEQEEIDQPSSFTFTLGSAREVTGLVRGFTGVDTSQPMDVPPAITAGDTGTLVAPSITTVTANAYVLSFLSVDTSSRVPIAPTGFTDLYAVPNPDRLTTVAAKGALATPGATGTATWSVDPSSTALQYAVVTLALRPATG